MTTTILLMIFIAIPINLLLLAIGYFLGTLKNINVTISHQTPTVPTLPDDKLQDSFSMADILSGPDTQEDKVYEEMGDILKLFEGSDRP